MQRIAPKLLLAILSIRRRSFGKIIASSLGFVNFRWLVDISNLSYP